MKMCLCLLLLLATLSACTKQTPTAARPKLADLGVVEMSDGQPIRRDLGDGRTCVITPTVITNGIRLAFVITQTNAGGVTHTLDFPVMERSPIGRMEVIVGDTAIRVTPQIKP